MKHYEKGPHRRVHHRKTRNITENVIYEQVTIKTTGLRIGLLFNFGADKFEMLRRIF